MYGLYLSLSLQVVYELPSTSQWIFECQWCPRNPAIISTASFDGNVTMYSLLGGGGGSREEPGSAELSAPVQSSGGDFFNEILGSSKPRHQAVESAPLKTPPKWFRRPCGASFAVSMSFLQALEISPPTASPLVNTGL